MQAEQITIIDNRQAYRARLAQAFRANPISVNLIKRIMLAKLFPIND